MGPGEPCHLFPTCCVTEYSPSSGRRESPYRVLPPLPARQLLLSTLKQKGPLAKSLAPEFATSGVS